MFGAIGGSLGGAIWGGVEGKWGGVKGKWGGVEEKWDEVEEKWDEVERKYEETHAYSTPQWVVAIGVATSGIVIDAIIGVAAVVIGALVVAHVIPLPMTVGTALITGGGIYMLLGFYSGTNAIPLIMSAAIGHTIGENLLK